MDALEKIIENIKRHQEENPTHGVGCSCMDEEVRRLRQAINEAKLDGPATRQLAHVFRLWLQNP